jgi:DNA invertase Pin-like site-specific DNA recombinase
VLAKQRGAYRGRKKSLNSEQIAELKRRVAAGDQKTLVARDFGISRETLYQYLRKTDHATPLNPALLQIVGGDKLIIPFC